MALWLLLVAAQLGTFAAIRLPPEDSVFNRATEGLSELEKAVLKHLNSSNGTGNGTGDSCDLCADRWLLVVSAGDGTGVDNILDTVKAIGGFHIGDDGDKLLPDLWRFHQKLETRKWEKNTWSSWQHGEISEKSVLCSMQSLSKELMGTIPPDAHTLGFKESHWLAGPFLEFMIKLFPCGQFIVSTRPADQLTALDKSESWQFSERQGRMANIFAPYFETTARSLPWDQLTTESFNNLLPWLGVTGCSFKSVCRSFENGVSHGCDRSELLDGDCQVDKMVTMTPMTPPSSQDSR